MFDDKRSHEEPWLIFSGDFLFVGSIGRPDLLGEEEQIKSTFSTLNTFPDYSEIYPGHGAGSLCGKAIGARDSSTVGYEKKYNASLVEKPETEWIQNLMQDMPPAPPYFSVMKKVNVEGPKIFGDTLPGTRPLPASIAIQKQQEGAVIVDFRSKESFADAHIPGSINIPLSQVVSTWAGWLLNYDQPLILVLDSPNQLNEVVTMLIRVGFDDILGYLENGINSWEFPLESFSLIHEKDFAQLPHQVVTIDVRSQGEWQDKPLKNAIHIPLGQLSQKIEKIPNDKPIYTICRGGYRAAVAASILQKAGIKDVHAVVS